MSMTDPIADLLTRIRNAQLARKTEVSVSSSKLKTALVKVLKDEGYVAGFQVTSDGAKQTLSIELKYFDGRPVIDRLERVSRPGPAHLPRQDRAAEDPGWYGYRHRLHAQGRDDRQTGAGHRAGRRSALHRGLSKEQTTMSRVANRPVDLPQGVTASVAANVVKVKGAKGELVAHRGQWRDRRTAGQEAAGQVRRPAGAHVGRRRARAPGEHGGRRVQGLRAQARAGRRRLPRRRAGQGAEPHARLLARGEFSDSGWHLDGNAEPDRNHHQGHRPPEGRPGRARRSAASVRRSPTRARASVTSASRSS